MNIKKKYFKNRKIIIFSLSLLFVLLFLSAELYVRITTYHLDLFALTGRTVGKNPMGAWALTSAFSAYTGRPGSYSQGRKTINKYGFTATPDIAVKKPDNTLRIVFLGGSSTACTGLGDKDTWPWQVAEKLRAKLGNQKIEFINAALVGYTTFESYGRLWSRIRFFSPDIIIVNHGWNEMYYFDAVEKIISWKKLHDGSWGFGNIPKIKFQEPHWLDIFIRHSQLLSKIRYRVTVANYFGEFGLVKLNASYDKRALDIFRTNLQLIQKTADIFNAKLFVLKQTTLIVPGLEQVERDRCKYSLHGFDHATHLEAFKDVYRVIEQEIPADNIIDATVLSGVSEYFFDHIHLSAVGSKKLAELVTEFMLPRILEK